MSDILVTLATQREREIARAAADGLLRELQAQEWLPRMGDITLVALQWKNRVLPDPPPPKQVTLRGSIWNREPDGRWSNGMSSTAEGSYLEIALSDLWSALHPGES